MNIHVCIKEIQDPEIAGSVFRVNEETKQIVPVPGLPLVTSPFDEQAIEAALRVREKLPDTKITIVTLGPKSAQAAIKRGLAMGADQGLWISDEGLEGMDGYATACILAEAIRKSGEAGLVLTGRQAADWDAGHRRLRDRGALERARRDVRERCAGRGRARHVERVIDDGFEIVETALPCVVTVSNELGEPRKATLRETMRAAKKPLVSWTAEDLDIGRDTFGGPESRQVRERLFIPVKDIQCERYEGSPQEIASRLALGLAAAKLIR